MSRGLEMTLEEARLIRRQAERGALDLELAGTAPLVRDATRRCERADLWGATPRDKRHSAIVAAGISAATLAVIAVAVGPLPI